MSTVSLALCALVLASCAAALPLRSERFSFLEAAPVARGEDDAKVRVDEAPTVTSTTPTPTEPKRQFPWPYPPVFESALPESAKQRLVEIYEDITLDAEESADRVNAVFDSLPQQVIEQLPLPTEFERLPFDVYKRLHYIHFAPGFRWAERQQLTQKIVESLPEAERQLLGTPRFGGPPPGFEYVLSPTIYKQLLFVHYNPQLSKEQRSEQITKIMHQVPAEQIQQLPLPKGMERLPVELQTRIRALVYDYSVPQSIRTQRVRDFVQSLPESVRPPLRRR